MAAKIAEKCPHCLGTGKQTDCSHDGLKLRARRVRHGLSARAIAQHMGFSEDYITMLESGTRKMRPALKAGYEEALAKEGA